MWALCLGLVVTAIYFAAPPQLAVAQDQSELVAELDAEFDARVLSPAEKRTLQLGLTIEGTYVGLIDGRWGQGSQSALEALAARDDPDARADGIVNYHVAVVARRAMDFLTGNALSYRGGPSWLHRFLAPPGDFVPDT